MEADNDKQQLNARASENNPVCVLLIGLASLLGGVAAYVGISALVSGSLTTRFHLGRSSPPMFPETLQGLPAILGGVSLIVLAVSIFSTCTIYPPLAVRLPAWTRRFRWWLFAASMIFYYAALHSRSI